MPEHKRIEVSGRIVDVFAHRFVIETAERRVLADLGPDGAAAFDLVPGLDVVASGEMKPSELKVEQIARRGDPALSIVHKPKHDHDADPKAAERAVARVGLEPVGTPRRKPKHFEVLARRGDEFVECHVELDGRIRKEKPVACDDEKWSRELRAAV